MAGIYSIDDYVSMIFKNLLSNLADVSSKVTTFIFLFLLLGNEIIRIPQKDSEKRMEVY